jgi:hypothetical protein
MKIPRTNEKRPMITLALTALATIAPLTGCEGVAEDDVETTESAALTSTQRTTLITNKYNANKSLLGSNINSVTQFSNGAKQDFSGAGSNSSIYVGDAVNAAFIVLGYIRGDYLSLGAQGGVMGYPTTDEFDTGYKTGRCNFFQKGRILWKNGATAAHSTHDKIDAYYTNVGLEYATLGYPVSDEVAFSGGRKNDFEYGKIYYKSGIARGVLTGINPGSSTRLAEQNRPRITSASLSVDYTGFGACVLKLQGAGFPPGQSVYFAANDPISKYYFNSSGTIVAADGTFSTTNNNSCTSEFRKINGYGTIQVEAGNAIAIAAVSSYAGTNYTGSM